MRLQNRRRSVNAPLIRDSARSPPHLNRFHITQSVFRTGLLAYPFSRPALGEALSGPPESSRRSAHSCRSTW